MVQIVTALSRFFPVLNVYSYGILLGFSMLVSLFLFYRELHRSSYKEERMFDMVFLSLFLALVVGRFTFFLLEKPVFALNPLNFFIVYIFPGFSLFGTVLGFCISMYVLSKKYKENPIDVAHLFFIPFFSFFAVYSILHLLYQPSWSELARALAYVAIVFAIPYILSLERLNKLTRSCSFVLFVALFSVFEFFTRLGYGPGFTVHVLGNEPWLFLLLIVAATIKLVLCFVKKKQ